MEAHLPAGTSDNISRIDQKTGSKLLHFRKNIYRGGLGVSRREFVEDINRMAKQMNIEQRFTMDRYRKYEDGFNMPNEMIILLKALGCDLNWLYSQ